MGNDKLKLRLILFIAIVAVLLTADLLVKELAFRVLSQMPENRTPGGVVVIPGFWSFKYTTNYDIGFSFLRFLDQFLDIGIKRIIIIALQFVGVAIAAFFYFSPKNYLHSWIKRLPLALIAAGGLGNAVDRIIRGFVVDYVLWYFQDPIKYSWPIFNLADTYTVVGVIALAAFILFTKKEPATKAAAAQTPPADAASTAAPDPGMGPGSGTESADAPPKDDEPKL